MGGEGLRFTRRTTLALSSIGMGVFAGAGRGRAFDLPALEETYVRVDGEGSMRFILVFENEIDPDAVRGPELLSVDGDHGGIEISGERSIGWDSPVRTSRSVDEYADELELDRETTEALRENADGVFDDPEPRALSVVEERPEDIVSGHIVDAVNLPDFSATDDAGRPPAIRLPEVRYVGGPIGGARAAERKHLQLPDGFRYDLPLPGIGGNEEWGPLRDDKLDFPDVSGLDVAADTVVPALSHRTNFALSGIQTHAGNRSRAYRGIASWAEQQSIEEYTSAVWDWARTTVEETLGLIAGPPSDLRSMGVFLVASWAMPVAAPAAIGFFRGGAAAVRAARLGGELGDVVETANDAEQTATLYADLQFDEEPPIDAVEAAVLAEPFNTSSETSASAANVAVHTQFAAAEAVQALAAADESQLPGLVSEYRSLLERQQSEIGIHRARVDGTDPRDAAVTDVRDSIVELLDQLLTQVETELALLRRFERNYTDVEIDVRPNPPGAGAEATLEAVSADGRPIRATDIAIDRTDWEIRRIPTSASEDSGSGLVGLRSELSGASTPDRVSGTTSVAYTFDSPGRYAVSVEAYLSGHDTPLSRDTEVDVVRRVAANIDVPSGIPASGSVELDASSSYARTDTELVSYEWRVVPEGAFEEILRDLSAAAGPGGDSLEEALREETDVRSGETVEYNFTEETQYRIVLTVTDDEGNSATESVVRTVGNGMTPEIVVATERPRRVGEPIELTADVATPGGQTVESHEWVVSPRFNFDPEAAFTTTAEGETVSVEFDRSGEHWISLLVTDTDGVEASSRRTVFLENAPPDEGDDAGAEAEVRIDGDPPGETDAFWVGDPVRFELRYDPAGTTVTDVEWEFTDGRLDPTVVETASGNPVTVRFDESASYKARASVETADGSQFGVETSLGSDFDVYAVDLTRAGDLDGDGLREDINGNGGLDFGDVVAFQRAVDDPKNPTLIPSETRGAFAFAGGGGAELVGQDDVEALYDVVVDRVRGTDDDE